jgi:hypothetical protein
LNATILSNEVLGGKEIKAYRNEMMSTFQMRGQHEDNKRNPVVPGRVTVEFKYDNPSNPALAI